MLFADLVPDPTTFVAVLFAIVTGLFGWLLQRDKLRYDARMVQLEAEVKASKEHHEDCEETQEMLRQQISVQKSQIAELSRRIDELTGVHRPLPQPPSGRIPLSE